MGYMQTKKYVRTNLLSLTLLLTILPPAPGGPCALICQGDIYPAKGGDGRLDLTDLDTICNLLGEAGAPFIVPLEPGINDRADMNADGQLDLEDCLALADVLLNAGCPFIAPCDGQTIFSTVPAPVTNKPYFRAHDRCRSLLRAGQTTIAVELYSPEPVHSFTLQSIVDTSSNPGVASNMWLNPGFNWDAFDCPGTAVNSGGTLIENVAGKTDFSSPPVTGVLFSFDYKVSPYLPVSHCFSIGPGEGVNIVGGIVPLSTMLGLDWCDRIVDAGGPYHIGQRQTITLAPGPCSSTADHYQWYIGDVNVANSETVSLPYDTLNNVFGFAPGRYSVRLRIYGEEFFYPPRHEEGYWRTYSENDLTTIDILGEPRLLRPIGGEHLVSGGNYTINWQPPEYPDSDCVRLEYSADNARSWAYIDTAENTGAYQWVTPAVESDQCLLRVSDLRFPSVSDTSDQTFTIFQCAQSIPGDLNGDCYVDLKDIALLSVNWLKCTNPFDDACQPR